MKQLSNLFIYFLFYTASSKWEVKHLVMLNFAKYSLEFILPFLKHCFLQSHVSDGDNTYLTEMIWGVIH